MNPGESDTTWRKCSNCKEPIAFGQRYYLCNVSTCNRQRAPLQFCCVECWEAHVPTMRHRESWAEENRAPTREQARTQQQAAEAKLRTEPHESSDGPRRRYVQPAGAVSPSTPAPAAAASTPREVLIIASRLKAYIRARCGMNTSDRVLEPLSEIVRSVCEEAIDAARRDGRSTVLDRDIPKNR